ncbi:transmembrane protein 131 [Canna indica]|uniref:Transmembrane protein 131 n=1 Tax=Canna indica TaxID=4628 RepID=A0AAQ3K053_9LILI|nr:transmembrane protein 131 [Canna indica]
MKHPLLGVLSVTPPVRHHSSPSVPPSLHSFYSSSLSLSTHRRRLDPEQDSLVIMNHRLSPLPCAARLVILSRKSPPWSIEVYPTLGRSLLVLFLLIAFSTIVTDTCCSCSDDSVRDVCAASTCFCFPSSMVFGLREVARWKKPDFGARADGASSEWRPGNAVVFNMLNGGAVSCSVVSSVGGNNWLSSGDGDNDIMCRAPLVPDVWMKISSVMVVDFSLLNGSSVMKIETSPFPDYGENNLFTPFISFLTVINTCNDGVLHIYKLFSADSHHYSKEFKRLLLAPCESTSIAFIFMPGWLGSSSAHHIEALDPNNRREPITIASVKSGGADLLILVNLSQVTESSKLFKIRHEEELLLLGGTVMKFALATYPNMVIPRGNLHEIHKEAMKCILLAVIVDSATPVIKVPIPCLHLVHSSSNSEHSSGISKSDGSYIGWLSQNGEEEYTNTTTEPLKSIADMALSMKQKLFEAFEADDLVCRNWRSQRQISVPKQSELFSVMTDGNHFSNWISSNSHFKQLVMMQHMLNSGDFVSSCKFADDIDDISVVSMKWSLPVYLLDLFKRPFSQAVYWTTVFLFILLLICIISNLSEEYLSQVDKIINMSEVGQISSFCHHEEFSRSSRDETPQAEFIREYNTCQNVILDEHKRTQLKQDFGQQKIAFAPPTFDKYNMLEAPKDGGLTVGVPQKRRRQRKRRATRTGLATKLDVSSSQSGNSTPTSPLSPNASTPMHAWHLSLESASFLADLSLEEIHQKRNDVEDPMRTEVSESEKHCPVPNQMQLPTYSNSTGKLTMLPMVNFLESGSHMPLATLTVLAPCSPSALCVRAPGPKRSKDKTLRMEEKNGVANEFTYDIWGNYFSEKFLCRQKELTTKVFAPEGSQSFFTRDPHSFVMMPSAWSVSLAKNSLDSFK